MREIIVHEMVGTVRCRVHEVDCEKLCDLLRKSKSEKKLNNKQIAKELGVPKTLVEHWFRRDSSFAIPEADIWFRLKSLLGITTTKYDGPITEFVEKEGIYEKSNRVYQQNSLSPTLSCGDCKELKVIVWKPLNGRSGNAGVE